MAGVAARSLGGALPALGQTTDIVTERVLGGRPWSVLRTLGFKAPAGLGLQCHDRESHHLCALSSFPRIGGFPSSLFPAADLASFRKMLTVKGSRYLDKNYVQKSVVKT